MSERKSSLPEQQPAGSPSPGEPVFLAVGKLGRPHGVRGEIFLHLLTDFPERLNAGVKVFLGPGYDPIEIEAQRWHKNALLLSLSGYDTPEAVGSLTNQYLFVRADDRPPLPEGEYYHHQLIGLQVVDEQGQVLGSISEILETGANDVYVVLPPQGTEILLPAIQDVILEIDLPNRQMLVRLLPGLLSE
jgi:16S rRNA processing protein RimM